MREFFSCYCFCIAFKFFILATYAATCYRYPLTFPTIQRGSFDSGCSQTVYYIIGQGYSLEQQYPDYFLIIFQLLKIMLILPFPNNQMNLKINNQSKIKDFLIFLQHQQNFNKYLIIVNLLYFDKMIQPNDEKPSRVLSSSPTIQIQNYKQLYEQEKKKVCQLQHQVQLLQIKLKKLVLSKNKGKICSKCMNQISTNSGLIPKGNANSITNIKEQIKKQMIDFSEGISEKIKKSSDSISKKKQQAEQITSIGSFDIQSKSSRLSLSKQVNTLPNLFPMIENFTIFGAPQQIINSQATELLEGQLLYSFNQPSDVDRQASRLVFPSGLVLKKLTGQKAKDKAIEMMSFSYTNLKSFILRFKCQQNIDQDLFQKNEFLWHVNPSKSLFCLCIGISDYTSIDASIAMLKKSQTPASLKQFQQQPSQSSSSQHQPSQIRPKQEKSQIPSITFSLPDSIKQSVDSNSKSSMSSVQTDTTQIYLSQRVFCISSYYPFFTFYQEIMRSLMNIIKMERLMIYKECNENLAQTDSKYQLARMQQLFVSCIRDLNARTVSFNRSYDLKLMNLQKITLLTDWNLAKTYFIQEWIYAILSIFNIDVFIDVLTLLMLEDKIVFVCNNSHILTYTIYLFTNILIKPLTYAFEVVSIIPEEDFLGAPFPVVYGMLRKRKYVEQSNILNDYKNTYIFLAPDKVDIIYTQNKKNILKFRPNKLKADLTPLFKDLKKQRQSNPKTPKYQPEASQYNITSSLQQKQISVQIVQKTNEYIFQEIINKMPNTFQIKNLKNSIDSEQLPAEKDEHTVLMDKIKEIVKKNVKESFAERLLDTQMISNLVCK